MTTTTEHPETATENLPEVIRAEQLPAPMFVLPPEAIERMRRNGWQGFTDDEIEDCIHICRHKALDPILRQIYFIPRNNKQPDGSYKKVITPQTGIDGYRAIAERTHRYAGSDDAVFAYNEKGEILSATVTVYKLLGGVRCPFTATAFMAEYWPERGDGMWKKMPHGQISKCAESLALRKAFPHELGGIYTDIEMAQADAPEPSPAPDKASAAPVVPTRAQRAVQPMPTATTADPLRDRKHDIQARWRKWKGIRPTDDAKAVIAQFGAWVRGVLRMPDGATVNVGPEVCDQLEAVLQENGQ